MWIVYAHANHPANGREVRRAYGAWRIQGSFPKQEVELVCRTSWELLVHIIKLVVERANAKGQQVEIRTCYKAAAQSTELLALAPIKYAPRAEVYRRLFGGGR